MEELRDLVIKEMQDIRNIIDTNYVKKDVLQNLVTKEEIEKLASEIATLKSLSNSKIVKDVKKEMVEIIRKAITTGTPNVNYTIPEEIVPQVMELINIYGIARKLSNVIQVDTQVTKIPVEGQVTAYWVSEAADIPETPNNVVFGTGLTITPKKLAGYIELSKEVLKYANISIIDYLLNIFSKQIAKEEDRIFLRGRIQAGDPFNGLENITPSDSIVLPAGQNSWNNVDIDHLILLQSRVHYSVLENSDTVYIMHPHLYSMLLTRKAVTSGVYLAGTYIDTTTRTFLGKKIVLSDQMPPNQPGRVAVIFGNFKMCNIFAVSQDLTIETSLEYGFKKDVVAIKLTELVAPVNVGLPNGFTYVRLAN